MSGIANPFPGSEYAHTDGWPEDARKKRLAEIEAELARRSQVSDPGIQNEDGQGWLSKLLDKASQFTPTGIGRMVGGDLGALAAGAVTAPISPGAALSGAVTSGLAGVADKADEYLVPGNIPQAALNAGRELPAELAHLISVGPARTTGTILDALTPDALGDAAVAAANYYGAGVEAQPGTQFETLAAKAALAAMEANPMAMGVPGLSTLVAAGEKDRATRAAENVRQIETSGLPGFVKKFASQVVAPDAGGLTGYNALTEMPSTVSKEVLTGQESLAKVKGVTDLLGQTGAEVLDAFTDPSMATGIGGALKLFSAVSKPKRLSTMVKFLTKHKGMSPEEAEAVAKPMLSMSEQAAAGLSSGTGKLGGVIDQQMFRYLQPDEWVEMIGEARGKNLALSAQALDKAHEAAAARQALMEFGLDKDEAARLANVGMEPIMEDNLPFSVPAAAKKNVEDIRTVERMSDADANKPAPPKLDIEGIKDREAEEFARPLVRRMEDATEEIRRLRSLMNEFQAKGMDAPARGVDEAMEFEGREGLNAYMKLHPEHGDPMSGQYGPVALPDPRTTRYRSSGKMEADARSRAEAAAATQRAAEASKSEAAARAKAAEVPDPETRWKEGRQVAESMVERRAPRPEVLKGKRSLKEIDDEIEALHAGDSSWGKKIADAKQQIKNLKLRESQANDPLEAVKHRSDWMELEQLVAKAEERKVEKVGLRNINADIREATEEMDFYHSRYLDAKKGKVWRGDKMSEATPEDVERFGKGYEKAKANVAALKDKASKGKARYEELLKERELAGQDVVVAEPALRDTRKAVAADRGAYAAKRGGELDELANVEDKAASGVIGAKRSIINERIRQNYRSDSDNLTPEDRNALRDAIIEAGNADPSLLSRLMRDEPGGDNDFANVVNKMQVGSQIPVNKAVRALDAIDLELRLNRAATTEEAAGVARVGKDAEEELFFNNMIEEATRQQSRSDSAGIADIVAKRKEINPDDSPRTVAGKDPLFRFRKLSPEDIRTLVKWRESVESLVTGSKWVDGKPVEIDTRAMEAQRDAAEQEWRDRHGGQLDHELFDQRDLTPLPGAKASERSAVSTKALDAMEKLLPAKRGRELRAELAGMDSADLEKEIARYDELREALSKIKENDFPVFKVDDMGFVYPGQVYGKGATKPYEFTEEKWSERGKALSKQAGVRFLPWSQINGREPALRAEMARAILAMRSNDIPARSVWVKAAGLTEDSRMGKATTLKGSLIQRREITDKLREMADDEEGFRNGYRDHILDSTADYAGRRYLRDKPGEVLEPEPERSAIKSPEQLEADRIEEEAQEKIRRRAEGKPKSPEQEALDLKADERRMGTGREGVDEEVLEGEKEKKFRSDKFAAVVDEARMIGSRTLGKVAHPTEKGFKFKTDIGGVSTEVEYVFTGKHDNDGDPLFAKKVNGKVQKGTLFPHQIELELRAHKSKRKESDVPDFISKSVADAVGAKAATSNTGAVAKAEVSAQPQKNAEQRSAETEDARRLAELQRRYVNRSDIKHLNPDLYEEWEDLELRLSKARASAKAEPPADEFAEAFAKADRDGGEIKVAQKIVTSPRFRVSHPELVGWLEKRFGADQLKKAMAGESSALDEDWAGAFEKSGKRLLAEDQDSRLIFVEAAPGVRIVYTITPVRSRVLSSAADVSQGKASKLDWIDRGRGGVVEVTQRVLVSEPGKPPVVKHENVFALKNAESAFAGQLRTTVVKKGRDGKTRAVSVPLLKTIDISDSSKITDGELQKFRGSSVWSQSAGRYVKTDPKDTGESLLAAVNKAYAKAYSAGETEPSLKEQKTAAEAWEKKYEGAVEKRRGAHEKAIEDRKKEIESQSPESRGYKILAWDIPDGKPVDVETLGTGEASKFSISLDRPSGQYSVTMTPKLVGSKPRTYKFPTWLEAYDWMLKQETGTGKRPLKGMPELPGGVEIRNGRVWLKYADDGKGIPLSKVSSPQNLRKYLGSAAELDIKEKGKAKAAEYMKEDAPAQPSRTGKASEGDGSWYEKKGATFDAGPSGKGEVVGHVVEDGRITKIKVKVTSPRGKVYSASYTPDQLEKYVLDGKFKVEGQNAGK